MSPTPSVPKTEPLLTVEQHRVLIVMQLFAAFKHISLLLCICFVAYMIRDVLVALAGTNTEINIIADFLADIKFALSVSLAGFAGLWAAIERRMRHNAVERLHKRVKELEMAIDPARSSSSLTPAGKTNPKDLR